MTAANGWTDHITFCNFALVLRGSANVWLKSQATLEDITVDRRAWMIIRPLFKAEFAIKSDDKRILDGLAHRAMKPTEKVRDYFGRLNKTNTIIMDAYKTYTILPIEPAHNKANQVDLFQMKAYIQQRELNLARFFLMNHFRAGLPSKLRRVLNLQNQDELPLSNLVKLATIEARSREEAKCANKVYAATALDDYEKPQIDAFHQNSNFNRQSRGKFQSQPAHKNNQQQPQNKPWKSNGQGNNSNRNDQTCIFCKMQNAEPPSRGLLQEDQGQQALSGLQWTPVLAQGQCC
jgi:hypothetical protein